MDYTGQCNGQCQYCCIYIMSYYKNENNSCINEKQQRKYYKPKYFLNDRFERD